MPALRFADVVLVPFPFTDQSGAKKRPAVVVSSDGYNRSRRDIIMAITSQVRVPLAFGEVTVSEWQGAGLLKPSVFKPVFATIEQSLVVRAMGSLAASDTKQLRELVATRLG